MTLRNIPWFKVRAGDLLQVQRGHIVKVAVVAMDGGIWDTSGERWHPITGPCVTVFRGGRLADQYYLDFIGRSEDAPSVINIEDRTR